MSWNRQGGDGQGPWGGGGGPGPRRRGPGGGPQGPDLEDFLRRGQARFQGMFPGRRGLLIIIVIAVAIWLASGFYRVQPDEQGVVLRFGAWTETTQPGLNYHLPAPIERVITPKVTKVNRIEIGYRTTPDVRRGARPGPRQVPAEAIMLTGDENIVDINFTVFWIIKDAGLFLFNIRAPEVTVKAVAESAMREIVGRTLIVSVLAEGRQAIETETQELLQSVLDEYGSGVQVTQVQLQKVDPPERVIAAFRDVQAAKADLERKINEAEAYRNDIIPRARGDGERIIQEAEAYKEQVVAEAEGEAQRFISVYNEYRLAKDVTKKRIYLETMENIFAGMTKVIIDSGAQGSQGVVPYLPLPELQRRRAGTGG